ncbi:MAG: CoA transferase [Lachnospiraceae bacterium]|nr:CoA transferase [Lachnospiraceae bacterium]
MNMKRGSSLGGLKVLDLGQVIAGPLAASMLADMGADVIKIEQPKTGDLARNMLPKKDGISTYFIIFNRGQRGITLNLKSVEGRQLLFAMIEKADVLIENFRPGVMAHLGLSYEEVKKHNPRIIYASVSGYGQEGIYADRACFDPVAQAMSGLMSVTGPADGEQVRCGASVCDVLAAQNTVIAILAALSYRQTSGVGQYIDVSLVDSAIFALSSINQIYFTTGKIPKNLGNFFEASAPGNAYPVKGGERVMISAGQASAWPKFAHVLGHDEWTDRAEFKRVDDRVKNRALLDSMIAEETRRFWKEELIERLTQAGIAAAPIMTVAEVAEDPHFRDIRQMYAMVEHPEIGMVQITNQAVKMSETNPFVRGCAPLLGEHNREVYRELGYTDEEIERFREMGVI